MLHQEYNLEVFGDQIVFLAHLSMNIEISVGHFSAHWKKTLRVKLSANFTLTFDTSPCTTASSSP
jgi:hypothetical protein